jgi:hypothetical protein
MQFLKPKGDQVEQTTPMSRTLLEADFSVLEQRIMSQMESILGVPADRLGHK